MGKANRGAVADGVGTGPDDATTESVSDPLLMHQLTAKLLLPFTHTDRD